MCEEFKKKTKAVAFSIMEDLTNKEVSYEVSICAILQVIDLLFKQGNTPDKHIEAFREAALNCLESH